MSGSQLDSTRARSRFAVAAVTSRRDGCVLSTACRAASQRLTHKAERIESRAAITACGHEGTALRKYETPSRGQRRRDVTWHGPGAAPGAHADADRDKH